MTTRAVATLTLADINRFRQTPGRAVELYLTDRCPVGCTHCSVDSRPNSQRITDFRLLDEILDGLARQPDLVEVGISGGEPFVEKRGLTAAVTALARAGKLPVVYTSGVWAAGSRAPAWIDDVLDRSAAVVLSTDAAHQSQLSAARFVRAAQSITARGARLIVQAIREPGIEKRLDAMLRPALGSDWTSRCDLSLTVPLPFGRGAAIYARPTTAHPVQRFGACPLASAPVVRYDGRATACCNELVIMGAGPRRLHRAAKTSNDVRAALDGFRSDPLIRLLRSAACGVGGLAQLKQLGGSDTDTFTSGCQACWRTTDRFPAEGKPLDPLLTALVALTDEPVEPDSGRRE